MKALYVVLAMVLCSSIGTAQAKEALKCEEIAKDAALQTLKKEDEHAGLNENTIPGFTPLNNGGIYIFSGWIEKIFDWQVVVIVDEHCRVKMTYIPDVLPLPVRR